MVSTLDMMHNSNTDIQQLIQQYKFTIEAIFDDQESRALFRTFLKKECLNEEPFLFYESVEKFHKTRLDKNRFELAGDIIDKFMIVGAQHELNLSTTLRNDILKSWKQIYEKNKNITDTDLISCPADLFTKAQDIIFIELKQDNFPRFVNSESFKKFIQKEVKKDASVLEKLGKRKSSSSFKRSNSDVSSSFDDHSSSTGSLVSSPSYENSRHSFDSSESDSTDEKIENMCKHVDSIENFEPHMKHSTSSHSVSTLSQSSIPPLKEGELIPILDELSPYITQKDHKLAMNLYNSFLNNSSDWTVMEEKVGMKTVTSKPVYTFSQKKTVSESRPRFVIAKSGIVPGTPKEWIELMYTDKVKNNICKNFSRRFQADYKSINEQEGISYPSSLIYLECPLPFPFTNRDFLVAKSVIPDKYDPATGEFGRYIFIQKPSYHHEFPPNKENVRANHYVLYVVEKKGNASVRYTCMETGDMLGNIPAKLAANFFKSTAKAMHKRIRKVCSNAYETHIRKETTIHDHDGGLATLSEYQEYYYKECK